MNRLAAILPAPQVLVDVEATSKKRAFEEAGLLFEQLHNLNRATITDSATGRSVTVELYAAHATMRALGLLFPDEP